MRRIACVSLPEIRVEIAREAEKAPNLCGSAALRLSTLAVVIARPGGAVRTERDVLGNTRVDVVSREALALGVRPGQTVAAARAKHAELQVRVVPEGAVRTALARIAEAALAFGPASAFDVAADVVWVDVGGCAHLHGGEAKLASSLAARVAALGHACRVAVADGPRIASAVARVTGARREMPLVVPPGQGAAAMRPLPVAALALDDDVHVWLRDLGLHRCGDLQKLPRRSLGVRLGARAHDVMLLLDGEDRAPLDPWRPPEVPEERVELEWGASNVEAIAFVVKTLCDRLAARLEGRGVAASRVELLLGLDRALCEGRPHLSSLEVVLPVPLARAADLLAVVRARLEQHVVAAPVLAATLRATELARAEGRNLELLSPEPRADRALPRLVAELSAELGPSRVGVLALADTWAPDERTRLVRFGSAPERTRAPGVTSALEPTRLVPPRPVGREALVPVRALARIEAVEWWRRAPSPQDLVSAPHRRDLLAAWTASEPERALAWVELRDDGQANIRGWVD
jgi:protein ImuB